jgi:hypothetical protein
MNNNNNRGNNNNNNRRRGRNNNNRQQGGGQQLNRIDSRARGNAPQMLEKYRKLAHDAHLNGDRVQEEYYLQFAEHYFRVIADQRARQEEQRAPRGDRWQEGGEGEREPRDESEASGEYGDEGEYAPYDRQQYSRNDRNERPERSERPERPERAERKERPERQPRQERQYDAPAEAESGVDDGGEDTATRTAYEPPENPFVRSNPEARGSRGLKPRRDDRRPQRSSGDDEQPRGLDPSTLPPAISAAPVRDDAAEFADESEAKPAPRRRAPRKKPTADDAGEALEVAG